jgi:hypothetical protein
MVNATAGKSYRLYRGQASHSSSDLWERSLLAIGCEAVARMVNAPPQESRTDFIAGKVERHPGRSHSSSDLWERSLLAIGCEAVAKMVNAPPQESRTDFIADKVERHPGRSYRIAVRHEICGDRRPCRSGLVRESVFQPMKMHRMYLPSRIKWSATPAAPTRSLSGTKSAATRRLYSEAAATPTLPAKNLFDLFRNIILRANYLRDTFNSHSVSAQIFSAQRQKFPNPSRYRHEHSLHRNRNCNRWP